MKIASVTNVALDPSLGSGKTVLSWSNGLRDLGHEVFVYPPNAYADPFPVNLGTTISYRLGALALENTLLRENFDIIEFYGAEFGLLINRLANIPLPHRPLIVAHTNGLELLARVQSDDSVQPKLRPSLRRLVASLLQPLINKWDYWAFAKVDTFAALCTADIDFMSHNNILSAERCSVVEPGIDFCYLAAPWNRPKHNWIVHFGTWCSRKDSQTTVEVVAELLTSNPHLEFHVIGSQSSKPVILDSFDISLHSRIHVYSYLSAENIVDILSKAKVLLFPSLYEGYGMAIAEAMACGCVVVATPTGFGSEIRDGIDGFICNFRDVKNMICKCQNILDNELLRMQVSSAAHKRVNGFSWTNQVSKLEGFYKSWLRSIR